MFIDPRNLAIHSLIAHLARLIKPTDSDDPAPSHLHLAYRALGILPTPEAVHLAATAAAATLLATSPSAVMATTPQLALPAPAAPSAAPKANGARQKPLSARAARDHLPRKRKAAPLIYCPECALSYSRPKSLRKHRITVHGITSEDSSSVIASTDGQGDPSN